MALGLCLAAGLRPSQQGLDLSSCALYFVGQLRELQREEVRDPPVFWRNPIGEEHHVRTKNQQAIPQLTNGEALPACSDGL